MPTAVYQTDLPLPHRRQGKVRDVYETTLADGTQAVVIVATDRISAYDVVMPTPIPGKGVLLTAIARTWFQRIAQHFGPALPTHLISTDPADIPNLSNAQREQLRGRVTLGRKTQVLPVECVARGYLAGSAWTEYQQSQRVCGVALPPGLRQCDKLPEPIFTPATKAQHGHDENITFDQARETLGHDLATTLRDRTLSLYRFAHDLTDQRGILLADTKFEFGLSPTGELLLIDEALTPDSSRFWPADRYQPGRDQESFDKQFLRNYLTDLVHKGLWNKTPPAPPLPDAIVQGTLDRYLEAHRLLTG